MNEIFTQFFYIILGWSLGILSPFIIKKISERREKRNLENIIFNDLKDLKKRLAPLSFKVLPKYGKMDKETFEWLRNNSGIDFEGGIKKLLDSNIGIEKIIEILNQRGLQENTLVYFKKMHLFAIDSHLINLSLIDSVLMEKILEIRFHVSAFNEDIDSFRDHLKMTFQPGVTDINNEILSKELKNKSLYIAKKSIYISDKINNILKNTKNRDFTGA